MSTNEQPLLHPSIYLEHAGSGTRLMVDGSPLILLAGELHNSSASSLEYVTPILERMTAAHMNAVLAPLSWELIEPIEGQFDFTLLDGLVNEARRLQLRLVFLWFGTMKNAISCYVPAWVKTDLQRFFRAEGTPGESSWTVSVFNEEVLQCDARAFSAVMRHIRDIDAEQHTVIMMQVENEAGVLNASRDHCPAAETAFNKPVPDMLINYLMEHRETLITEFAESWGQQGYLRSGTWKDIFGADADEVFMAWHVARFIAQISAAGAAEYPLPLFVNAWLIAGPGYSAGQYPSGGPISKMLDVWRAAAPHISLLAPDIYHQDFRAQCASYTRSGNPLFIPEAMGNALAAANVLYAIGQHEALCFSPFGIDAIHEEHPLVATYRMLADMMPLLTQAYGAGRLAGFVQQADEEKFDAELGNFRFHARTNKPLQPETVPGSALLLDMEDNTFYAIGRNLTLTFTPLNPQTRVAELVYLDTGDFHQGNWIPSHRLNGDETSHGTGVHFRDTLGAVKFELHSYK